MKYKTAFFKIVVASAVFLFLFVQSNVFSKSCFNFNASKPLMPLLHSMQPAHTIINDGENIVIEKSGSYHIIENITGTIKIKASDVIIHLNGFTLTKFAGSDYAIEIEHGLKNIVIKDGVIKGNGIGVGTGAGIVLNSGTNFVRLENLTVSNFNKGIEFRGSSGGEIGCCRVTNCMVSDCASYAMN